MLSGEQLEKMTPMEKEETIDGMEQEMLAAAKELDFERAAQLRDEIDRIKGLTIQRNKTFRYNRRS